MVDITGAVVKNSPLLSGSTNGSGKLISTSSLESGYGYVHLRRDAAGAILPNAKGLLMKAVIYDSYSNLYTLNFSSNLNVYNNTSMNQTYLLPNKGDKKVVNFYYGSGDSRVKQVY